MEFLECKDDAVLVKYFQEIGIIVTEPPVRKKCNVNMKCCSKKDNIDKVAWRCTKGCGSSSSIRKGSFVESFNKDLHTFLKLLYHWAIRTPHKVIQKELDIGRNSITTWQQKFKLLAVKAFDKNSITLGGTNVVVEIDESLFIKVTHHKGNDLARPQFWVFGLYERDTKRILF